MEGVCQSDGVTCAQNIIPPKSSECNQEEKLKYDQSHWYFLKKKMDCNEIPNIFEQKLWSHFLERLNKICTRSPS